MVYRDSKSSFIVFQGKDHSLIIDEPNIQCFAIEFYEAKIGIFPTIINETSQSTKLQKPYLRFQKWKSP